MKVRGINYNHIFLLSIYYDDDNYIGVVAVGTIMLLKMIIMVMLVIMKMLMVVMLPVIVVRLWLVVMSVVTVGPEVGGGPVGRGRDRGIEVVTSLGIGARPIDVE